MPFLGIFLCDLGTSTVEQLFEEEKEENEISSAVVVD